jgi:hypothetical protein
MSMLLSLRLHRVIVLVSFSYSGDRGTLMEEQSHDLAEPLFGAKVKGAPQFPSGGKFENVLQNVLLASVPVRGRGEDPTNQKAQVQNG